MKRLLILLFVLCVGCAFGQKIERVNPIYGSDEQANKMITYISENLQMVIPKGRTLADVNGMMRCRITIDPFGKISDIKIQNSIQLWLDVVIIESLKAIPPSPTWKSTQAHELKKALVFSFGNMKMTKNIYGYDKEKIDNQIEQEVNQQRDKQQKELAIHWSKWQIKNEEMLKLKMPLSPDKDKNPSVPLKDKSVVPPVNLPKVTISLE